MAHFAQLDENNNVIQVDVVDNSVINDLPFPESEPIGVAFLKDIYGEATKWVQTSYNSNFRSTYAMIGGFYDATLDCFVYPKPYASWVKSASGFNWEPPVPLPDEVNEYVWDEAAVNWVKIIYNQDTPTQV
jgi:hypothetical protein